MIGMWAVGQGIGSSLGVHCRGVHCRGKEVQASSLNTSLKGLAQAKVMQYYERSQKVWEGVEDKEHEEGVHSNTANAV